VNRLLSLIDKNGFAPAAPRYRQRPRVDLASGVTTGLTIQFSAGVPAISALDLGSHLAALAKIQVSVQVAEPLRSLPGLVSDVLERCGLQPSRLEMALEGPILEQAGVDCLVALSAVRDLGVDIALQDFGGPGTLGLVHHLPLSVVILPPSAIMGLPGDATASTLLHTLLSMAKDHRMRVVATGIESEAQRALLSGLGCEHGEGSLFGVSVLQTGASVRGAPQPAKALTCRGHRVEPASSHDTNRCKPAYHQPCRPRPIDRSNDFGLGCRPWHREVHLPK
jgi:EAL domain-containing protein (putative c-di-GMP-specific phosphodiesterase class I)